MPEREGAGNERITERAEAVVNSARDKAADLVESARGGAGNLQAALADRLEAGAETIRADPNVEEVGARTRMGRGSTASTVQERAARARSTVANGMDGTAMWLRENDLTDIGGLLQRELRERPGRVALLALGLGILVGRASRRR